MQKTLRLLIVAICAALLITALPTSSLAASVSYDDIKNETTEELKAQLDTFAALRESLKDKIDNIEDLQASAAEKRSLYLTMKSLYDDEIALLEAQLRASEEELNSVNQDIARLKSEYEDAYAQLMNVLRMTYESENSNYIELILGASSFTDLLSRIERAGALISYNNKLINTLEETQAAADAKAAELTTKTLEQSNALANVEAKRAEIDEWSAENEATLLEIEAELDKLIGEYEDCATDEDVLEKEFQEMVDKLIAEEEARIKEEEEKRRQEAIAEANKKNGFLWPLPSSYTRVSSYYGPRTIPSLGYYNKMHYGIDLPAPRGTSIYSVKDGTVIRASYDATSGLYLLIDHGNGIKSLYAHCSKLLVSNGDVVKQGQTIALVGTTGSSTGNHLHIEIRINNVREDPLDYLQKP